MSRFEPKAVLRKLSPQSQKAFFADKHKIVLIVNWSDPPRKLVDGLFSAWQQLPDAARHKIEIDLQAIEEVAGDEKGIDTINETAQFHDKDLRQQLLALPSRHDMALWTMLEHEAIWNASLRYLRGQDHFHGRAWYLRPDSVMATPKTDAAAIKAFSDALSAFYVTRGKGHHCHVQHYRRRDGRDFFFCTLSDHARAVDCFDESGVLTAGTMYPAFEAGFSYDRETGRIELYADGGRKTWTPLEHIFGTMILGVKLTPHNGQRDSYKLSHLLDPQFRFATRPEDGILAVGPRRIRFGIVGDDEHRVTLETTADRPAEAMQNMIETYLNREKLPREILEVERATLAVKFGDHSHRRSVCFDIARPNTCTLKSKPEDVRARLEKYLPIWNFCVA